MGKQAIEGKRGNLYYIDPFRVTIVGRDTDDGPEHPLYDPKRANRQPDPARVKNIRVYGVQNAVKLRKNGKLTEGPYKGEDVLEVVDGRGRTIDCRVANEEAAAAGEDPPLLKVELSRGDEDTQVGVMISLNELRLDDTPLNRARKAVRLLGNGWTLEGVAEVFGVSTQAVRNWQHLVELSKKVQAAVDEGKIAAHAALKLKDLSHKEQDAKLKELLAMTPTRGNRPTVRDVEDKKRGSTGARPVKINRGLAKKLVAQEEWVEENLSEDAQGILQFIAGNEKALEGTELFKYLKWLSKPKPKAKKAAKKAKGQEEE